MNQIYIYDGHFDQGDLGRILVREAASRYGWEKHLPYDFETAEIERTEKGKPFFVDIPVAFSLTHSGMMWMCMLSDQPCGLDLQVVETTKDYDGILRKRYTPEEQHYVELWGKEGFYEIWVRKEAFVKCTGQGIFSQIPSMVDENTDLKETVVHNGQTYHLESILIAPEMKCAVCMMEKKPIELRILG